MDGFPNYISKTLLHHLKWNVQNCDVINKINNNKETETEIFFHLLYTGSKGEQLVKHCLKEIRRCLEINVKFVVIYDVEKISFYCNVKDKVLHEQRKNIVYRIRCLGCDGKYIRKTERCLIFHMNEHRTWDTELMFKRLWECEIFKETCNLYALPSLYNEKDPSKISLTSHILSAVLQNHEILDFNYNWLQLLSLESCYMKKHDPVINHGLKASRELLLFNWC